MGRLVRYIYTCDECDKEEDMYKDELPQFWVQIKHGNNPYVYSYCYDCRSKHVVIPEETVLYIDGNKVEL